jgi:hypothetical protein
MTVTRAIIAGGLLAFAAAAPANAVTNLIKNGSFEAGALGNGAIPDWTRSNAPAAFMASVIGYSNTNPYPTGAFGEAVTPDNSSSLSPDAIGTQAAYFVSDVSNNETLSQLRYVGLGNYRIGFSYYLPDNGLRNVNNANIDVSILGIPVASTAINSLSLGQNWVHVSGVANFALAGHYLTSLIYNSNGNPAKDVVIDRVYAIPTLDPATVFIPPNPTIVPEPQTWALMILGFGLVGVSARRRKMATVAA